MISQKVQIHVISQTVQIHVFAERSQFRQGAPEEILYLQAYCV